MDRSEILKLIKVVSEKDEYGMSEMTETTREVYVNVKSISSSEFFQANQTGLQPQYQFTLFAPDYDEETVVEYRGERYKVYRTYHRKNDLMELYVEKVAADGD